MISELDALNFANYEALFKIEYVLWLTQELL